MNSGTIQRTVLPAMHGTTEFNGVSNLFKIKLQGNARKVKNLKQIFTNIDKYLLRVLTHTHRKYSSIFFAEII